MYNFDVEFLKGLTILSRWTLKSIQQKIYWEDDLYVDSAAGLKFINQNLKKSGNYSCLFGGSTTWTEYFKCREVKTGFYRNRSMQTGSSGTLIGWISGQTTFVPLWDRMEGALLRTQIKARALPKYLVFGWLTKCLLIMRNFWINLVLRDPIKLFIRWIL